MSPFKIHKIFYILSAVFALTMGSLRADAEQEGHGGDPVTVREAHIRSMFTYPTGEGARLIPESLFKADEMAINAHEGTGFFKSGLMPIDSAVLLKIKDLVERGLESDMFRSTWVMRDHCYDFHGIEKAATSMLNDLGGEICVSPHRLAVENASDLEIEALTIHEHAHHFGYKDRDNAITTYAEELLAGWRKYFYPDTPPAPLVTSFLPEEGLYRSSGASTCNDYFTVETRSGLIYITDTPTTVGTAFQNCDSNQTFVYRCGGFDAFGVLHCEKQGSTVGVHMVWSSASRLKLYNPGQTNVWEMWRIR